MTDRSESITLPDARHLGRNANRSTAPLSTTNRSTAPPATAPRPAAPRPTATRSTAPRPATIRQALAETRAAPTQTHHYPRGKRIFDASMAGLALVLLAPLMLTIALISRLVDGPHVLFAQRRVGHGGKEFILLKFRSLAPESDQEAATRWNVDDDERLSGWGNWLRRTSLDELPQLINVLRGEMSLVGPRPERPHFVNHFSLIHPRYPDRHRMPVGLTGLAQVNGLRGDTSISERARLDNHYIDNWSFWVDLAILLRTPMAIVRFGS